MITSFRKLVQYLLGVPSKHLTWPVNRTKFADSELGIIRSKKGNSKTLYMGLNDFAKNMLHTYREDPKLARYKLRTLPFHKSLTLLGNSIGWREGSLIWDRGDWDICVILDACRADLMKEVLPHSPIEGDWKVVNSIASHSKGFVENTFADERAETAGYVTANTFSDKCDDKVAYLDPTWKYDSTWDEEHGTVLPRTLSDRAIAAWQNRNQLGFNKLVIHYMQPHIPFIPDRLGGKIDPRPHTERTSEMQLWGLMKRGEFSRDQVWEAYKANLEYVLDEIDWFLDRIEGQVAITSDHGNAIGEWFTYGHPQGVPMKVLRQVPWLERKGRGQIDYNPEYNPTTDSENVIDNSEITDRLEALGYR